MKERWPAFAAARYAPAWRRSALTLPLQRREALARVLESEGLLAIEDDPYWPW
ncbi:hypothetical protein [Stenotrophomonas maltophilia]|uniref:hypothetical protein n=1 Tax=Stenotrophomonas maltophilia TaxID=40324 RepID=UPI0015DFEBEA|nr:hypothetical protein [Stenotrophomonas maltophilia]